MTKTTAACAVLLACAAGAQAADSGHSGHRAQAAGHAPHPRAAEQTAWGRPGNKAAVTRTIEISMTDAMRFTPDRLEIRQGETVRFRVKNAGKLEHELVLGTKAALDRHAAQMQKPQAMEHHEEESGVEVKPGRTGELVWTFNRAGDFFYACLLPGHYQAGMVGALKVVTTAQDSKR